VDSQDENTVDPLNLSEFRDVPDDQRVPSPVTPEPLSRAQTPESPQQLRKMTEGPHLLTTEILQTLLAARDRAPQTSYPKLQDPEPFEGEKAKFKTFLAQCELKFGTEGNRFDDDEKKTGYASSLLRGVAWNWVETFLNQEGGFNLTWEELKTSMKHAFGQVDAEEIAFEKFQKIQQGSRRAATYWAEFQRIKADLPYADNVCIARFRDGLHPEVKQHLVMSEVPATVLIDYATAAIKTDSRLCNLGVISRRLAVSPEARFHVHTKETLSAPPGDPMDLDATRGFKFAPRANRFQRRPPTDECYNCGKKGHCARECPQPKKPRTTWRRPYGEAEATYEENTIGTETREEPEPVGNDSPREQA